MPDDDTPEETDNDKEELADVSHHTYPAVQPLMPRRPKGPAPVGHEDQVAADEQTATDIGQSARMKQYFGQVAEGLTKLPDKTEPEGAAESDD